MASTYVNDLRLNEMATGDASGSWGTITNTNLELIGEAFGYGTETIGNADTTITMADGASDAARSFYLKITSSADLTTTRVITLAPNTVSKVWMIENATSGSQIITIKQGTGATINIPNGHVKMVATDGAGSGGAVLDLLTDLNVATNLFVKNAGTGDGSTANIYLQTAESDIAADDVIGKINFQAPNEGTGTDAILVSAAIQATSEGDFSSSSNATSLNFMTGASEAATTKMTLSSAGNLTVTGIVDVTDTTDASDATGDTGALRTEGGASIAKKLYVGTDLDVDGTANLDVVDIDGAFTQDGGAVFNEDSADVDFRVESNGSAYALFVDGGNNHVNILTSTDLGAVLNVSGNAYIQHADNSDTLTLESTDDDANNGPNLRLFRNSANPAADDQAGRIDFDGEDSSGGQTTFARVLTQIKDPTNGTEDGRFAINTVVAGSIQSRINVMPTETVFNDESIDLDFRVESNGNANMLFVDGANDGVAIGHNNPQDILHISTTNAASHIRVQRHESDEALGDGDEIGAVEFWANDSTSFSGASTLRAAIRAEVQNTSLGTRLEFYTGNSSAAVSERMRIIADGKIGINQTEPSRLLHITDTIANSGASLGLTSSDSSTTGSMGIIHFGNSTDSSLASIGAIADGATDSGVLLFKTEATGGAIEERMRINSSGGLITTPIAGGHAVFNEGSVDADFRVESNGNANMLFVDGGNDVVSIGGTTVESGDTFAVVESGANVVNSRFRNSNDDANGMRISFEKASGNPADDDELVQLDFLGRDSSGNAELYAGIQCFANDVTSGTEDGSLRFGTVTNATYRNRLDFLPNETVINQDGVGGINFRIESDTNENMFLIDSGDNTIAIGTTDTNVAIQNSQTGINLSHVGRIYATATDHHDFNMIDDGEIFRFRSATTTEGNISVSGSTVSYNGFSGTHESSGIATNIAIGTVVSTIDELDVYAADGSPKAGQTRADHAKVKVSDSVGDKRVYGVVTNFNEYDKAIIAAVGIGSVKVTGACVGGDLLESNGDGTAKVQSDDIIRSKTIAKVTIGNSNTGVKLVSCVLYCG